MVKKLDISELLVQQGLVTKENIEKAKVEMKRTGLSLEGALQKLGFITEENIVNACANALGVPSIDITNYIIDSSLVKLIPEASVRKYKVVPLFKIGQSLTVGMINPQDIVALDHIRKVSGIDNIEPVLVTEKGIQKVLDTYYSVSSSIKEIVDSIDRKKITAVEKKEDLVEVAEEAPVIKLVNVMISKAIKDRASDIHVEPTENNLRIRNRIDGVLHEAHTLPKSLYRAVTSRIKLLADMDIAESRRPQDGRIRLKIENKNLDIRVSTFPTVHGENVVMRLLDKSSIILGLEELGFSPDDLESFRQLIQRPNGIILVTGPTGSGKTTTLYSALSTINSIEKNIITIEDPVEYELPLIRQTQVNPKIGVTFASGLRAILRQDPDIIMVGEIRDKETADIAIRAALTGHLVFSTLHTNDAPSALTRLIDMGIEPFLISSAVIGVLAQRLVRLNCPKCKEKYVPAKTVVKDLDLKEREEFYQGKGCKECKDTGFLGRIGIFELLVIDEEISKMVNEKKPSDQICQKAIERGMRTLWTDGIEKAKKGLVSPDEVVRVTKAE